MQKGKKVEKALQIAEKKEVKGKGEKERYPHLNAEFQRIVRRDLKKKALLSEQCKGIEENNRMGKTRGILKKIRGTKQKQKILRTGGNNTEETYTKKS